VVGGSCAGRAKPSWQAGLFGNPADSRRDLPDVSLFAANGIWGHYFVYCFTDPRVGGQSCSGAPSSWSGAGGTSFSAPIMAGIQALVNQRHGLAFVGNPNPVYYQLAAAAYGSTGSAGCNSSNGNAIDGACVFQDITPGDMDVNCSSGSPNCYRPSGTYGVLSTSTGSYLPAYKTGGGWDFATGIGSVNAANLVGAWPPAAKLAFNTQPAAGTAGSPLATIKVSVHNAAGNVVAGSTAAVTLKFGSNPGAATLGGTLTVNAVNGVASFSNITVSKAGSGFTLVATAAGLTSATSSAFNIVSAGPTQLAFSTQPPASKSSSSGFAIAVAVKDASGATVSGNSASVTIALTTPNGAILSGIKTVNAVNGVASYASVSVDKAGTYTLTATANGLTSALSNSFTITPGAAAKIAFTTQPPGSVVSSASFGVAVSVRDAAGNTVTGNTSSVHVALTSANGATLTGTTTRNAVAGVATFSGLALAKAGSYTLTATDGVLPATLSSAFTITPGAAAQLVFTVQPSSIVMGTATAAAVSIKDAAGNVESADNASQIVLKVNACNSATLATVTVSGGVAAFPSLHFDAIHSGLQLQAQAAALSAGSASFNVITNGDQLFVGLFDACVL
jgi:hypothetical protein